jgi:hypothetical protein
MQAEAVGVLGTEQGKLQGIFSAMHSNPVKKTLKNTIH